MSGVPPGRLYLVPAPLDFGCATQVPIEQALPQGTLAIAARLEHWICENARSTRAVLKRVGEVIPLSQPVQALQMQELPRAVHKKGDHDSVAAGGFDAAPLLAPALAGHDIGLISEAGMPAVADPGSSVVRAAHEAGIEVLPLIGPSALLLALAASGQNGQNFAFVGYLPQESTARTQRIRELESLALRTGQTQMFIETPYRNTALLEALIRTLQPKARLSVSVGLSLPEGARTRSATVKAWKQSPMAPGNELPAVFAIGR